jgi:D-inositol-3-phosphate glycosyltransferase
MDQPQKIALVKYGTYTSGGLSSVCRFLFNTIAASGQYDDAHLISIDTSYNGSVNVRLLSPQSWFHGIKTEDYSWHNIPAKHVGSWFSELESQRYMPRDQLTEILNQFDLIQIVSGSPATAYLTRNVNRPVCIFIATLARLERKTMLQTASVSRKIYSHIMLPFVSWIEIQALKRVDHVFAETDYTRQAILPHIDASKISIDTIGVDTLKFQPIAEEHRTNDFILSVGRLADPRKNIALLFESYARLRQRMSDPPPLILAGKTAPSDIAWNRAKELDITNYISVQKDVSFDDLVDLYQNAALFVLSSNEEGLGIVLLEAMACATPVISTRCGGPDSIVSSDVGFLSPVGDANVMADRMAEMLQNPEQCRQMGQQARQLVERRFSNEVVGRKYLDVYEWLLS